MPVPSVRGWTATEARKGPRGQTEAVRAEGRIVGSGGSAAVKAVGEELVGYVFDGPGGWTSGLEEAAQRVGPAAVVAVCAFHRALGGAQQICSVDIH